MGAKCQHIIYPGFQFTIGWPPILFKKGHPRHPEFLLWHRYLVGRVRDLDFGSNFARNDFMAGEKFCLSFCRRFSAGFYDNDELGGGFKHFLFSPLPGEMIQFDYIFQQGWSHQLVNPLISTNQVGSHQDFRGKRRLLKREDLGLISIVMWTSEE